MRPLPRPVLLAAVSSLALGGLATVALTAPAAQAAPAQTAYALSGTNLLSFDPAAPTATTTTAITNVTAGETLVGIDVRPQNGFLYALGVNPTADTGTLYVVNRATGYAGLVGTAGSIRYTSDGVTAVDLPDPATTTYGFDFNPAADRLRITAGGYNLRVDPNSATPLDGSTAFDNTNPDGAINGATTTIGEVAYTNSRPNSGAITTLYTLDAATNSLYIQNPPNAGTQTAAKPLTLAGVDLDFTRVGGFDIDPAVVTAANNAAVTAGTGYAVLTVGGVTGLYSIDLTSGAATLAGPVGAGTSTVSGLALQGDVNTGGGRPIVALSTDGASLTRFQSQTPGTVTTVAVGGGTTAPAPGEKLVGIAWRPNTGQLVGLGVNATADTASLYVVDPQTGTVTLIGASPGTVAFIAADGATIDLPDPTTAGYGVDFNPTVDRVRIVATTGFNGRANPVTGAAVDGNFGGAADSVANLNPDGPTTPGLSSASYTNAQAQGAGGATTEYALEAANNQLVVVNPPNVGTLTQQKAVTAGGKTLDFAAIAALDIPGTVSVASSNAVASGFGFAALDVGGATTLYSLDLGTAVAAPIGALTTAVRSIAVGEAFGDKAVPAVPTASTSPTSSPTASPTVKPGTNNITTTGKPSQQKKTVLTGVTLNCGSAATTGFCSATVVLKAKVRVKGKRKSVVIGKGGIPFDVGNEPTVDVPVGKSAPLSVTVNGKGKKALKAAGKLKATITLTTPTGTSGAPVTTKLKVTLKAKKL